MKTSRIVVKIIKYLLNLAGLYFMYLLALGATLAFRRPDCDDVSIKISENVGTLLLRYIPYLGVMMGLNLLIERKLEKRAQSMEYLYLLCLSFVVLVIAVVYTSYQYASKCVNY